jgi:hypothetical protein
MVSLLLIRFEGVKIKGNVALFGDQEQPKHVAVAVRAWPVTTVLPILSNIVTALAN